MVELISLLMKSADRLPFASPYLLPSPTLIILFTSSRVFSPSPFFSHHPHLFVIRFSALLPPRPLHLTHTLISVTKNPPSSRRQPPPPSPDPSALAAGLSRADFTGLSQAQEIIIFRNSITLRNFVRILQKQVLS